MRIKNLPSIESMNGSQDAFVIEQTDGSEDKSRKVSPAQIKQFIEAGDFEATGEVKDGHGNILKDMAKAADVDAEIGDLSQTGVTGDSVAEQLTDVNTSLAIMNSRNQFNINLMKNRGDVGGDLNNVKVNGLYTFRTSDTNTPTSWGTLMVINVTPDNFSIAWIYQVAFGTDGHIYHRRSINGAAFNAWATIV